MEASKVVKLCLPPVMLTCITARHSAPEVEEMGRGDERKHEANSQ